MHYIAFTSSNSYPTTLHRY